MRLRQGNSGKIGARTSGVFSFRTERSVKDTKLQSRHGGTPEKLQISNTPWRRGRPLILVFVASLAIGSWNWELSAHHWALARSCGRDVRAPVALPSLPSVALVTEMKNLWMNHLREYLERFHESRAGAIEIVAAIGQVNALVFHGTKLGPIRSLGERRHFPAGARDVESAGHHDEDFRIVFPNGFPVQPGRVFAGVAKEVQAPGQLDQFRHPIAGRHEGLEPFDAGNGWPRRVASLQPQQIAGLLWLPLAF